MCIIRASIEKNYKRTYIVIIGVGCYKKKNASLLTARARRNGSFDYRVLGTLSG